MAKRWGMSFSHSGMLEMEGTRKLPTAEVDATLRSTNVMN